MGKISSKIEIQISDEMIGQRLDKALSFIEEIGSRSRAEHLIEKNLVFVNEKNVKASHRVSAGDNIIVDLPPAEATSLEPMDLKLEILFEDADLIVINKPAGLVVHPAAGHAQDTLVNALIHHTDDLSMKFGENRPGIVHRLDKDTSGVLVVAKNDFTHERLALQFKEKTAHRIYHAICLGVPGGRTQFGTIQSYLARHPTNRKKYASVQAKDKKIIREKILLGEPSGKWAVTHYKVLKSLAAGISYLELKLETGRTHQIRVHLSEIGFPILADEIYGSENKLKNLKPQGLRTIAQEMPRLALHATELGFTHPRIGEKLFFKVDWPEAEKRVIEKLGLAI